MKTLRKEDMAELIGQFIDVVEDFLEAKKEETEKNGEDIAEVIEGDDYDMLATKFRSILTRWELVEEREYLDLVDAAELEEWNTPTD